MKVYELKINLKLKKNLQFEQITEKTNYFIDYGLLQDQNLKDYHINRCYKSYVHDLLYPIEKDGLYKNGKIYTMRLRTIDEDLAKYFLSHLAFSETIELKGIGCEIRIIPQKVIKTLYSVTPVVLKNPGSGYWRNNMVLEQFEKRLKDNLIKKYKYFTKNEFDENFIFYNLIEFKNKVPIKVPYKNICLLGDKISIEIAQNKQAQDLAYLALGVGLLENNSRSFGFMNFKYM